MNCHEIPFDTHRPVYTPRQGLMGVLIALILLLGLPSQSVAFNPPYLVCQACSKPSFQVLPAGHSQVRSTRRQIQLLWPSLTRSVSASPQLNRDALVSEGQQPMLYVPSQSLASALSKKQSQPFAVKVLPECALKRQCLANPPGLLYVPHPYVVPGGRFNELFGWDSYFIVRGLMADGEWDLARDITNDLLFEIEQVGFIPNANRTYYLTRSQPPLLAEQVVRLYRHQPDPQWLRQTLPLLETYHNYFTAQPHLTPSTGLSRYIDEGFGLDKQQFSAPEVEASEKDAQGQGHYERVKAYLQTHPETKTQNASKSETASLPPLLDEQTGELTPYFYLNDRSMRESGFDPSHKFGLFGSRVVEFNPVGLNSLLYKMEMDIAILYDELGESTQAQQWRKLASQRQKAMDDYLWDKGDGQYYDYHLLTKGRRAYPFATTFYPLWVGAASKSQAESVVAHLKDFETDCGLLTSLQETGNQWDAPYGWAPLHLIAVEGLRRYGYNKEADRLGQKYLSLVSHTYKKTGQLWEKYDVKTCGADSDQIQFGYTSNEVGFGWTNGVFSALQEELLKP